MNHQFLGTSTLLKVCHFVLFWFVLTPFFQLETLLVLIDFVDNEPLLPTLTHPWKSST